MHTFVKRALWGALIAGGMTLIGATAANAAETGGDDGLLSGTQLEAPISIPVTIADNAISLLGGSSVETPSVDPGPSAPSAPAAAQQATPQQAAPESAMTDGTDGIGSGTQALVDVTVPIDVSGNAISLLGESAVGAPTGEEPAAPGADEVAGADETTGTDEATGADAVTDGTDSVLGGSQIVAPVDVPVTVGGNAVALLGETRVAGGSAAAPATTGGVDLLAPLTGGSDSLLGGSQIALPVSLPVTVGGNGIAILGESTVAAPVPGVNPGTDPGPIPGADPEPVPTVNPTANPGGTGSALPAAASAAGMLATTGGAAAQPLALTALALLGAGGALLRRRAA